MEPYGRKILVMFYRVLMIVHNIWNYWVSGLSIVSYSKEVNLLETGLVSPQLRMETDPVSKILCSLEYKTMDKVQEPNNLKSQVFIILYFSILLH
jgi:hypothetical protein